MNYLTSDELCNALFPNPPELSEEEKLIKYKMLVDKTPNKFLKYHLDWSIKKEHFELAAYIRDTAKERGFEIKF